MAQNMISIDMTDEQVATAMLTLDQLEAALAALIALTPKDRIRIVKMGRKSEVFCRQALSVMEQNPQIVPATLDLAGARADLAALDRLRPVLDRVQRLAERGRDTELALGSDIMDVATEGYRLLKVSGRNQGLQGQLRELQERWNKSRRSEPAEPAEVADA